MPRRIIDSDLVGLRRLGYRRPLFALAVIVVALITVALVRTFRYGSAPAAVAPVTQVEIPQRAAERLASAVRFRTISSEDPATFDPAPFLALHGFLETAFPRVRSHLQREIVGNYSLLYRWDGSDPSLEPILFMGHMDVVPVEPGTESAWQVSPFEGRIADGYIWGRGAIDNKSAVLGTLEAVEMLLAEGFRPTRTVYLAFGHDEEAGGTAGARAIAELFEQRGVRLEMVIDEGGVIGEGLFPGVSAPVALVGIAEKGFLSIEVSTRTSGGHSSLPPAQSAIGIISAAVARLEASPMPARFEGPTRQLFERIGSELTFAQRLVFANLWLTRPLVTSKLEDSPSTNAMIRTTTAATIFQAGTKDNLLPGHARAVINFRILPGDSIASTVDYVRQAIDDPRVDVKVAGRFSSEPSNASSASSPRFRALERTIRSVNPDALVAPYLVVVVTDARYFTAISSHVFRFLPVRLASADLARMHGTDERISIRNYEGAIRLYRQLVLDAASN